LHSAGSPLSRRQLKAGYFLLEAMNAFGTSYYFHYLFFFLAARYQFADRQNLRVSALHGLVYVFSSWWGGNFAQRRGCFTALKTGLVIMVATLLISSQLTSVAALLTLFAVWTFGICFTWPTLEALVAEKESPAGLQKMLGIYNMVWAGSSACAYFIGGALLEKLGTQSMFWVPLALHVFQFGFVCWLERQAARIVDTTPAAPAPPVGMNPRPISRAKLFLRLAWIANPFAYIAISSVVPVIPSLAKKFGLSPMFAGFFCSLWFFARFGAFVILWLWNGWHYRFRYFIGAFGLMIASFIAILTGPSLALIAVAQIVFGLALGLIYCSSLFYSMDVGETKSEHGGLHEAAIGAGLFAGPAVSATSLYLFAGNAHSGIWAVSGLLLAGLAGCVALKKRAGL
jgi:predicted MFS family arabinose efflux permease